MKIDKCGIVHRTADELCSLLYVNPELDLYEIPVDDPTEFNHSIKELFTDYKSLERYLPYLGAIELFDGKQQANWYMPNEYKNLDIAKWVLDQCHTDEEIQRVGKELLMYQERNLLVLLQFMKYFVDHLREHNIGWGVGRGSSVSSYVLFLIGVHKINALYYDLDINEFLK